AAVTDAIPSNFPTTYCWDYDVNKETLRALYDRAKLEQWNAQTNDVLPHPDWSTEVIVNEHSYPDERFPISSTDYWRKFTTEQRDEFRRHATAWSLSQFMHGEQGALLATAKIVKSVPSMDAKYYAATQVMDEARHVEVYHKYLSEKLQTSFPITTPLRTLLDAILTDSRWDMTYLGMQILVEGLALAAFGVMYNQSREPLIRQITQYIMADEARHVAFGVLSLRDIYPQMTSAELKDREEFTIDACYLMRDRFAATEVFERFDLPVEELSRHSYQSPQMQYFRNLLFMKIVPNLRKLGLLTPRVREEFARMGVLEFEHMTSTDEEIVGTAAVS
ncbi:MAG TPA: ferritin-like domain-containing protein, partial [Actinomycetota bacterium]|nr:ferritin-like domain-containing protein [Actinomycetota bacterium]